MVILVLISLGTFIHFPLQLHLFTFPPTVHKSSNFSTSLGKVVSYCDFNLHLSLLVMLSIFQMLVVHSHISHEGMSIAYFFFWLNDIPLYGWYSFLNPFTYWRTSLLFPRFGNYKQNFCKYRGVWLLGDRIKACLVL